MPNGVVKKTEKIIKIKDKPDIVIRLAKISDMRRIQMMYAEVYGVNYSIPLIIDKDLMRAAIENDQYYWLVAETNSRIIASLIYVVDDKRRLAKAFGAVVSREYREHDLAQTMMKLTLDNITKKRNLVDLIYATTRTTNVAPQRLTASLGFLKLGVFPNTHKVYENETHCLTAYYTEKVWAKRKKTPVIIKQILPFYQLVQKQIELEEPKIKEIKKDLSEDKKKKILEFEIIKAPNFIKDRFSKTKGTSFFRRIFMPFHEPNLLFITPDQSTEVYLTYSDKDKYSVILGGTTSEEADVVLESVSRVLNNMNMAYVEVVLDAYEPELQYKAMMARYIPSGYFPCAKKVGDKRHDCVVFSRTFEALDLSNVKVTSLYKNFLKEYVRLWEKMYISSAFENEE
ncbi:MAG: hypothetical protein KAI33_04950, partial [Elusimicrobiales bacterium]|nr:hypothetical protein [Elusimicrobiales bacterium]